MNAPALSIHAYKENFDFRDSVLSDAQAEQAEQLNENFYVPLEQHRGAYTRDKILAHYHLDETGLQHPDTRLKPFGHVLLGGHVGSGKSTELRELAKLMKQSYSVHRIELTRVLDINNLRFSDLVISLAEQLAVFAHTNQLDLKPTLVEPVLEFFQSETITKNVFRESELEVKAGVSVQTGIPLLLTLLGTITAKIRGGASYKSELRREVQNGFTVLANHFNALIAHTNDVLRGLGKGPLLFMIDGSDRLNKEDSAAFFNTEVNQLLHIQANLLICAPISVLLEVNETAQRFELRQRLPMIKLFDREEVEQPAAVQALVDMVLKRLPLAYFDGIETVQHLVRHCGGHPRDLLRLVNECFTYIDKNTQKITLESANHAITNIASEYERNVTKTDWVDLVAIDTSMGEDKDRTPERLRLLYSLVLLEYNSYWWRSHPLVRTIPSYKKAHRAYLASVNAAPQSSNV